MPQQKDNRKLEAELTESVEAKLPGVTVEVGLSERWKRMCVTFRWTGFAGLLPEERFQRLVRVIPETFREERLGGFVWLELTPDESIEEFLAFPRSEDMADRESAIYAALVKSGFFDRLAKALGPSPDKTCGGDFAEAIAALSSKSAAAVTATDAKLVLIRHGVYCDCQVLQSAQPELADLYAGVA